MHPHPARHALDAELTGLYRLAIQIEGQRALGCDLQPRQPRTRGQLFQRSLGAGLQHLAEGGGDLPFQLWQHGDIQQPVVDQGLRAQLLATAGLAAIADAGAMKSPSHAKSGPDRRAVIGSMRPSLAMPVIT